MLLSTIIINEWKILFRNRSALVLLITLSIISILTIWQAGIELGSVRTQREKSVKRMRDKFTGQGEVNPHSAAHYGHFVYKPVSFLSIMDEGINPYTGTSIRLEAHSQNEAQYSTAQDSSSLIRFGQLRLNLLLQVIAPLLIIFLCFSSVSSEKEAGTLRVISTQSDNLRTFLQGKILAHSMTWWTFLLIISALFFVKLSANDLVQTTLSRISALFILYAVYFFIVVSVSIVVSATSKSSASALVGLLSAWFICTILLPKMTANLGELSQPLMTKIEMEKRITEDNKNGINGHDPSNERTKRFEDSVLKAYKVDTASNLTVNLDGLTMQADEEYHNVVYDKHFTTYYNQIIKQGRITAISGLINPFAATRNLSMAISGTDTHHHLDFVTRAEDYRRFIIKSMNDEMAYGGSKTGDWEWAVKADYWEKIPDFKYKSPALASSLSNYKWEIAGMLFWLLLSVAIIQSASKKINLL